MASSTESTSASPPIKKIPEDGYRPDDDFPTGKLHVLFIEGFSTANWMEPKFVENKKTILDHAYTFRIWCRGYQPGESKVPPDAYGTERCIQEIESGKYHAIVLVDYSNDDWFDSCERDLGTHLTTFVENGGVIAFPTSESLCVPRTLKNLFGVQWQQAGYYRTDWHVCAENELRVQYSFGNGNYGRRILKPYSCKGCTLRGVPPHERCFGVVEDSKTQSLVPHMTAQDVGKKTNEDYDVIVAMHEFGKGVIAYFGDVNAEDATLHLVSAFIESRAPKLPVDCFAHLEEDVFEQILELKTKGTAAFSEGNLHEAEKLYKQAVELYGFKLGKYGPQREEHVKLLSNIALIHMKQKKWKDTEIYATKALEVDEDHEKSLYRRAKANYELSKDKGGDKARLQAAKKDLLDCVDPEPSARDVVRKLFLRVEKDLKDLEAKTASAYQKGFAKAFGGS